MKARKLWIAAFAICCAALAAPAASAAAGQPHAYAAKSRVSIHPYPDGLFGYVKSPSSARCANHRSVAVFKQHGEHKHPRRDKRIATSRAKRNHGFYQWSAKTSGTGTFYAKAKRKPGCRTAVSRSLRVAPGGVGTGTDPNSYPKCGPYVREADVSVCRFDELEMKFSTWCTFGDTDDCNVEEINGLFPWGRNGAGGSPVAHLYWNWGNHQVLFVASKNGTGVAHLGGTMPSSNSDRYTITDGFAQDDRGYPYGQHFYTPDLPGQAPNEPGGPLHMNFVNGSFFGSASHAYIEGYLYVCPSDTPCGG